MFCEVNIMKLEIFLQIREQEEGGNPMTENGNLWGTLMRGLRERARVTQTSPTLFKGRHRTTSLCVTRRNPDPIQAGA